MRRFSRHERSWLFVAVYFAVLIVPAWLLFGPGTGIQIVFSGLLQGMLIFLVAAGMSIVFGLLDVLNFAQGAWFMLGAYIGFTVYEALPGEIGGGWRFAAAALAATLVGAALGLVVEIGLIRPLYKRPIFQILMTFGLATVMEEAVRLIWGPAPHPPMEKPGLLDSQFYLLGQQFSVYRLFIILVGLVMVVAVMLLLKRTRVGLIIRAGVQDSEMVEALGINVRQVFTWVFALGTAVASLGGMVVVPFRGATLGMGNEFLLAAIIVVVIGGMGSYEGTVVASVLVGLTRATAEYLSLEYFEAPILAEMSILMVMVLVLLVQPSGLFGREE